MCEFYHWDEDGPIVWSETERTARKAHRCNGCGGPIAPKTRYLRHFSKHHGVLLSEALCSPCAEARGEFADSHEGILLPPSGLERGLYDCIAEGDDASETRWRPMLEAMAGRRGVEEG